MMLPRNRRFKLNEDKYIKFRDKGRKFHVKGVSLSILSTEKEEPTRFAVIVPKKLDKRASKRNRTRRLIATAVQDLLPEIKPGHDVLIMAETVYNEEKLPDVSPRVEKLLRKARLI